MKSGGKKTNREKEKKIILSSKGDNNWKEKFDTEERAYWFLWGVVSEKERYFSCDADEHRFSFDCEDDLITWEQDGKKKYCAGWHWMDQREEEQIIMPNGKSLYSIMSELEN